MGRKPKQVNTDGHTPYPRAIEETLGKRVEHRVIACVGNPVEQDHRGIKQRYYPMLGFKACFAATGGFLPGERRGAELFPAANEDRGSSVAE